MTDELKYYLGFSAFPGIGPLRFKLLIKYFGTAQKAWLASEKDLLKIGLGEKLTQHFISFRNDFSLTEYQQKITDLKINVISLNDKLYPELLKEIPGAPFLLYVRGNIEILGKLDRTIAVVGTRLITSYGETVTRQITSDLVSAGFTIVSGMAYGVDTIAHQTVIDLDGQTIAVLGCGVDVIHPKSNTTLYWKIIKKYGLVISEFPVGQFAAKGFFPARNRIISGLSLGTVVTEGAADSGALITARFALEQGREVFAVPGPITSSLSKGPTSLLKQGAKLVTEVGDILEELKIKNVSMKQFSNDTRKSLKDLTLEERKIIELLRNENLHFDELIRVTKIESAKLSGILTILEIKKLIKNFSDGTIGILTS
ncbi:DNA-protecting protein DprA [Candidatus Gottesmanbacteria bacterium]|nr:DNA-protecting protein DprA [Candidatus Gottesmanbacteria bacterium]